MTFKMRKDIAKESKNGSRKGQSLEMSSTEDKLKDSDIHLRLIMHHGIPTTCNLLAYDPVEHMLALATKNGYIKVFTHSGMESILQTAKQCAIHFLQIFNKQCLLICSNAENVIEIWDTITSSLRSTHKWSKNITALGVIQDSTYFFIGDDSGTITVMQYDIEQLEIIATAYVITLAQIFGDDSSEYHNTNLSVKYVLPQPSGEHERVLICYANGLCVLWALHDGEVIAVRAHTSALLEPFFDLADQKQQAAEKVAEEKSFSSACWSCGDGLQFATGYSDGDFWLWSIDQPAEASLSPDTIEHSSFNWSCRPLCKLNIGGSASINVLRWWEKRDHKQKKEGFLCALGGKTAAANDVLKVISVNDARMFGSRCLVGFEVSEQIVDCTPVHCMTGTPSEICVLIMALGSQGKLYVYDVNEFLQSVNSPSLPKAPSISRSISINFSLSKSRVTMTKLVFVRKIGRFSKFMMQMPRVYKASLSCKLLETYKMDFIFGCKQTEYLPNSESEGFYLYITGHEDGLVYFWDVSTQITLMCGPQFKDERDRESVLSERGSPISSLDWCPNTGLLAVGYATGLISLHQLNLDDPKLSKEEQNDEGKENRRVLWSFVSKFHTHKVPISCIVISSSQHCVASGCENGVVSLFDIRTKAVVYNSSCFQSKCSRIISLNFVFVPRECTDIPCCGMAGPSSVKSKPTRELRVLVTTKDLGVLVLDGETHAICKTSPFKLENPSSIVSSYVLGQDAHAAENEFDENTTFTRDGTRQFILLCLEKALCIYDMASSFRQGLSPSIKVKVNNGCHWASIFQTPDKRLGLVLLCKTGNIELRCLPTLNLLRSIPSDGFLNQTMKPPTPTSISCTSNGRIALIKSNSEILVLSCLDVKHDVRCSELLPRCPKDVKERSNPAINASLDKKKKTAIVKVIKATNARLRKSDKENKASNQKGVDLDLLFTGKSSSSSGSLQSSHPFTDESNSGCSSSILDMSGDSLDIDDIEIDDEETPKDGTRTSNRSNLFRKVKKNLKGKEKQGKPDSSKVNSHGGDGTNQSQRSNAELAVVSGPRTIGEIKAMYKQGKDHSVVGTAAEVRDKLIHRNQKIGEIENKTADMQEGAQHFNKMAEELVKAIEEKNKRRFF